MLTDESPAPIGFGEQPSLVEGQAQRGCVCAQGIIGLDCSGDKIGPLRFDPDVRAEESKNSRLLTEGVYSICYRSRCASFGVMKR